MPAQCDRCQASLGCGSNQPDRDGDQRGQARQAYGNEAGEEPRTGGRPLPEQWPRRLVVLKYARIRLALIAFAIAGALMILAAGAG